MVAGVHLVPVIHSKKDTYRAQDFSISEFFSQFMRKLNLASLPFWAVSTLFSWGTVIPQKWEVLKFITKQYAEIKAISSTFAIPRLIVGLLNGPINLFNAGADLNQTVTTGAKTDPVKVSQKVKNVYYRSSAVASSILRVPQLLHKTGIIDLTSPSNVILDGLAKTDNGLSMVLNSVKIVDYVHELLPALKKSLGPNRHEWKGLSPYEQNVLMSLATSSTSFISSAVRTASLFFGVYIAPVAFVATNTLSFVVSLICQVVRNNDHITGGVKSYDKAARQLLAV